MSANDLLTEGTVCIANIGPKQQQRRRNFGLAMLAVGVIIAAILIVTGINPLWRVGLFAPFYLGGVGYFQARDKT